MTSHVALFTEGVDWNDYWFSFLETVSCRPLHRGCGLKFVKKSNLSLSMRSPFSQRVWIEIVSSSYPIVTTTVALFTEGVDWNIGIRGKKWKFLVALFTEGVDWNLWSFRKSSFCWVALFTEGVDWNVKKGFEKIKLATSPSSQRVWIEMHIRQNQKRQSQWCRPLHRGCGLKFIDNLKEMWYTKVALFTEGVDWNL